MTVLNVRKDPQALTMTLTAEFDATPERVWQLWADPRQLERWWGPPTYPATVTAHDLRPGGRVSYHMTGPEGDQPKGIWQVLEVDPPRSLVFLDLFADENGQPNPDLPTTTARVSIENVGVGRSRMSIRSEFPTVAAMEQQLKMGMEEGLKQAVGQIDAILSEPTTHTLAVPGAVLTYDVRENTSTTEPPLMIIGSPMGAAGFATLAGHFTDRTVLTYDPRGADRSQRTDNAMETTTEEHADDLHRLIAAVGKGPVDVFASSGGAVNALALVARHPEDVRNLVAHEPPVSTVLPDREAALAANVDIHETYMRSGFGPAMAKFIALVMIEGPIPPDWTDRPAPDPATFGLPTADDGSRDDALLGQNMISSSHFEPDLDALRRAPTRIVIAVGETSAAGIAGRAAIEIARRLGLEPVTFPGGHDGFLGGEYGRTGRPDEFAARLREVLG